MNFSIIKREMNTKRLCYGDEGWASRVANVLHGKVGISLFEIALDLIVVDLGTKSTIDLSRRGSGRILKQIVILILHESLIELSHLLLVSKKTRRKGKLIGEIRRNILRNILLSLKVLLLHILLLLGHILLLKIPLVILEILIKKLRIWLLHVIVLLHVLLWRHVISLLLLLLHILLMLHVVLLHIIVLLLLEHLEIGYIVSLEVGAIRMLLMHG